MKKIIFLTVIVLFTILLFAQESVEEFKPTGKPFVTVFANYHSSFMDSINHNAFEIQRAYFGYSFDLSQKFSGKVCLDVGNPEAGKFQLTAYLKNAYVQYKEERFTAKFGLIGLSQFDLQDGQWGNRYLHKSFQSEYKFGHSADLGLFASYKIHEMVSIDATISNGDGYKSVEADSILKYSGGITIKPLKGLDVRVYYDYMGTTDAQQTISTYAGYTTEKISIGAEYNMQANNKMKAKCDLTGLSFYGAYKFEKFRVFARYDQLSSVKIDNANDPWNIGKDGQRIIGGIEIEPVKGLKIAPNYHAWLPSADGASITHFAYLSCEIKF